MDQLPKHHLPRPRVVSLVQQEAVTLVEAGSGYGKSVLATEYRVARPEAGSAVATLSARDSDADRLWSTLFRALQGAGLTDVTMAAGDITDAELGIETLVQGLSRQSDPVVIVLDDVQHAVDGAQDVIVRLADTLPPPHKLLLLGRTLPPAIGALERRGRGASLIDAGVLAFTQDEVNALYRDGFGLTLAKSETAALHRATGGWPAALVVAAGRVAREGDIDALVRSLQHESAAVGELLSGYMKEMEPRLASAVVQLSHLPLVDKEIAAASTRVRDVFDRAAVAGIPFSPGRAGWWELPGPVEDWLSARAPLRPAVARRAAREYRDRSEIRAAAEVLLRGGLREDLALLLAGLHPAEIDRFDLPELESFVSALTDNEIEHQPRVLLQLARACEPRAHVERRSELLARAARILADGKDPRTAREVDGERARDCIRDGDLDQAESLANAVLEQAGPDEIAARARASQALALYHAWRRDLESIRTAGKLLEVAAGLCRRLGETSWTAQTYMQLGVVVHYSLGEWGAAVRALDEALQEVPERSPYRAVILTFRGEFLADWGHFEEAEDSLREARELAVAFGDQRGIAYCAWTHAIVRSFVGDAGGARALVAEAERNPGDWMAHPTGASFLADAADLLDRVGEHEHANHYLRRALERVEESESRIRLAEGIVLARSQDPAKAEEVLSAALRLPEIDERDRWRIALFRARAAQRRGDSSAGRMAAEAFDAVAALGAPSLPLLRERDVARELIALAIDSGSAAAASLSEEDLPVTIRLLGDFQVARGGRSVALQAGRGVQALKVVATAGGRSHAEEVMEALWPEEDPEVGRKRLRNVLSRLAGTGAGHLLKRDGESLVLDPTIEVDAHRFEKEAHEALAADRAGDVAAAAARARSAVARYRGVLLPGDPYAPWAAAARERLTGLHVRLLDLLVRGAETHGDIDEAVRLLEQGIASDPYDEARYVKATRLLLGQGRRTRAARIVVKARELADELGVPVSAELQALSREMS